MSLFLPKKIEHLRGGWVMVFNATFNNISAILWQSVLLVEETGVPGQNHHPVASHWQTFSHNVVSNTPRLSGIRTHMISLRLGFRRNFRSVSADSEEIFCQFLLILKKFLVSFYILEFSVSFYKLTEKFLRNPNLNKII